MKGLSQTDDDNSNDSDMNIANIPMTDLRMIMKNNSGLFKFTLNSPNIMHANLQNLPSDTLTASPDYKNSGEPTIHELEQIN